MASVNTDPKLIDEVLSRSVDTIYPSADEFKRVLASGKQLRIYCGIDPTATYVHLGHSTNYLILERLHQMGHKIIILIGDFTAKIGDPSDKTAARQRLNDEEIQANLQSFKAQIGKIIDFKDAVNPVEFVFNSEWLAGLDFEQLAELASHFTVQQMLERDMFAKRIKEQKPLYVHEFFYPLMQGYDSVMLNADVELGGTDQTFNMLAGRTLVERYQHRSKFVVTTTLLENPKTGEKLMSKSLGTGIGLDELPKEMFGKVMTLPDEALLQRFIDCTKLTTDEIKQIDERLKGGENPRNIKMELAHSITSLYHSAEAADEAQAAFVAQFQKGEMPEDIPDKTIEKRSSYEIAELLVELGLASSKSEAGRLLAQGGVRKNSEKLTDPAVALVDGDVLQVGKRHFARIRLG